MSSAGRRTSFRPGRSSITGRVAAAVITATAWSRVRDLDGRPSWPLGVSASSATLRTTRSFASALWVPIIHPCWSGGMLVFVEDAAEPVPPADVKVRDLFGVGYRFGGAGA